MDTEVEFESHNNGDIWARKNSFLLGVWLHEKREGTFRLSNVSGNKDINGTGKVEDLSTWIQLMYIKSNSN